MAIRKRGKGYQTYWRNPLTGIQECQACGTLKEARKLDSLIKHRKEHERETFAHDDTPTADGLTVEGVVSLYLKDKQFSPANLVETLMHFVPCNKQIGHVLVTDLTKAHMRDLVATLKATGIKQNTVNRKISIVRAALNWADEQDYIASNPVASFKCLRGEDKKIIPLTPAEIRRIIEAGPSHVQRAVILGFHLGVRIGPSELFSIGWEHVDMERKVIHVKSAKKNRKVDWREVGVTASLEPLLTSWGTFDGWKGPLIRYEGKAIGHMRSAWRSTLKAAGVERYVNPYSLRHAFATYALSNGADIGAVAKVMGHADTSMIHRHYQHVLDKQRRQVTDSLPEVFDIRNLTPK